MLKKTICILYTIFFFALIGCDPYVNKQPTNYNKSYWKCETPEIYYEVYSKNDELTDLVRTTVDSNLIYFGFGFSGNAVDALQYVADDSSDFEETSIILFHGTCKYLENKFTIYVDTKTDTLFSGKYEKLVFKRIESDNTSEK